jgi:hypothetical protein
VEESTHHLAKLTPAILAVKGVHLAVDDDETTLTITCPNAAAKRKVQGIVAEYLRQRPHLQLDVTYR